MHVRFLALIASVGYFNASLMISALPGQFGQYSSLLFSQKGLGRIVCGRQAVEGECPGVGTCSLAVRSAFRDRFGGEAGLAGTKLDDLGAQASAAETTCKSGK